MADRIVLDSPRMSSGRERRARDRLVDILNGDWHDLDVNTRRGLTVIADEVDGLHEEYRALRRALDDLRKTVLTVGGSVVTILVASAIGVFFTR